MNEFVAADPASCESSAELRLLLSYFGPYTGRYLAAYPASWAKDLAQHAEALGPVEAERFKTLVRRAVERMAVVNNPTLRWEQNESWISNFKQIQRERPKEFFFGVVKRLDRCHGLPTIDDVDLSPTADEAIEASPPEFVRVSRTLLLASPELTFIDPYLNPCRKDRLEVLSALLAVISKGKCKMVTCWARDSEITGLRSGHTWDEIKKSIKEVSSIFVKQGGRFNYRLLDDLTTTHKMHARYLLSLKGAIRFDQGFQRLTKGKKIDVSPVGKTVHEELITRYIEGNSGMNPVREITF